MMNVEVCSTEIEFWFNRIYKEDSFHGQFAPIKLSVEMINKLDGKVNWSTAEIAVLYDLSLLIVVYEKVKNAGGNVQNIKFFCSFNEKKRFAEALGVKVEYIEQRVLVNWLKGKHNMKFDAVLGNPPYQTENAAVGAAGGNTKKLWIKFVRLSLDICKENGYICLIHPISWRNMGVQMKKNIGDMFNYCFLHINLRTAEKYFKVGSKMDWYVLRKAPSTGLTHIDSMIGSIDVDLKTLSFIPNVMNKEVMGIINKVLSNPGNMFIGSDERIKGESDVQTEEFPYMLRANSMDGSRWYGRIKHPLFDKIKVTIETVGEGGTIYSGWDNGDTGVFRCMAAIFETSTEAENAYKLFTSKIVKFIAKINNLSRYHSSNIFQAIPRLDFTRSWTDEELYSHFGLTQEEIDLIESTVK